MNMELINNINKLGNYDLSFELQCSFYLREILKGIYDFKIIDGDLRIYKLNNENSSTACCRVDIEELIYFLHYKVPRIIHKEKQVILQKNLMERNEKINRLDRTYHRVRDCFGKIDKIYKCIDIMRIYLKYHTEEETKS